MKLPFGVEMCWPWQRTTARQTIGYLATFGAIFCGYECWSHYERADKLVQEVRQASVFQPPPGANVGQAATLQATELATERTVLAGEETAMRIYGLGALSLLALGKSQFDLAAIRSQLDQFNPATSPNPPQ